jgi:hypothetical protein
MQEIRRTRNEEYQYDLVFIGYGSEAKGGQVTREPGPVKGGKTVIAFVKDPDGYMIELIDHSI